MILQDLIETPCGKITLLYDENYLISIEFGEKSYFHPQVSNKKIRSQLISYFSGEEVNFDFNFDFNSLSPFLSKTLRFTRDIPYGKTMSYSEIATILNTSPRAIGVAMRMNPLPILIPCHRVVGKKSIGGYSAGINIKECLLKLEKVDLSLFV